MNEYCEEQLKKKLAIVKIPLIELTGKNDYRVIYSSDVEGLNTMKMNSLLCNSRNVMLLILEETGCLFGIYAKEIQESVCQKNNYFVFSINNAQGCNVRRFVPNEMNISPLQIGSRTNVICSIKHCLTITTNDQNVVESQFNEYFDFDEKYESSVLVGKVSPNKFKIHCMFVLKWY